MGPEPRSEHRAEQAGGGCGGWWGDRRSAGGGGGGGEATIGQGRGGFPFF